MPRPATTQSLTLTQGGALTFVLPGDITTLALNTRFTDSGVKSGETLSAAAQGEALDTLLLEGNGRIEWDNSATDTTALTFVDASALSGGLEYKGVAGVQESIDLGGADNGADVLQFAGDASRYGQQGDSIDTIIGFDGMQDTLLVDDEIMASFETIDFNYAVVAHDAGSLEKAFTQAGEQASGGAVIPVLFEDDFYLYRDSGPAGLDENDFALRMSDVAGGINTLSDRRDMISDMAPAPVGPFVDVAVDGTASGSDNTADSFVLASDGAWRGGVIVDFEPGIDRIDVTALIGADGQALDSNDIHPMPAGDGSDLMINEEAGFNTITLIGVPKYDPGAPVGELAYIMGPEDFVFA